MSTYRNTKCRIQAGWGDEGKEGRLLSIVDVSDVEWAVVVWDGDDEPSLFKAVGLEVKQELWKNLV